MKEMKTKEEGRPACVVVLSHYGRSNRPPRSMELIEINSLTFHSLVVFDFDWGEMNTSPPIKNKPTQFIPLLLIN